LKLSLASIELNFENSSDFVIVWELAAKSFNRTIEKVKINILKYLLIMVLKIIKIH